MLVIMLLSFGKLYSTLPKICFALRQCAGAQSAEPIVVSISVLSVWPVSRMISLMFLCSYVSSCVTIAKISVLHLKYSFRLRLDKTGFFSWRCRLSFKDSLSFRLRHLCCSDKFPHLSIPIIFQAHSSFTQSKHISLVIESHSFQVIPHHSKSSSDNAKKFTFSELAGCHNQNRRGNG